MPSNRVVDSSRSPMRDYIQRNPLTALGGSVLVGGLLVVAGFAGVGSWSIMRSETNGSGGAATSISASERIAVARDQAQPVKDAAPAVQTANATDCQEQTWPYIARPCLSSEPKANSGVRVISTDKLSEPVVGSLQAPPVSVSNRRTPTGDAVAELPPKQQIQPQLQAKPAEAVVATVAPPAPKLSTSPVPLVTPAAGSEVTLVTGPTLGSTAVVKPAPAIPNTIAGKPGSDVSVNPPDQPERRMTRRERREAARQERAEQRMQRRDARADWREERRRMREEARLSDRGQPRIVERWIEREFNVPSESLGGQSRRVVVIQRGAQPRRGGEAYAEFDD